VKVSYTKAQEAGERSKNQPQIPITVRSVDGFTFPVDVRITYNIREEDAPQLVANVGDDDMILDKLVTPTVRAIFRNNAEQVKALDYVQNRSKQEKQSQEMLVSELAKYGVTVLEVRIGDVGDETTLGALLKTQTDREIAIQEQITLEEQQRAAEKNKALEKTLQEAVEERVLATAAYGVQVADQNKLKLITEASATAEQITLIATAQAEAYKKVSDVIGANNAALLELMKTISENNIRITPDVMVSGGGANSGTTDALMGTMLKGMINKDDSVTK
jgi:bifunctional DNA-binding transcriptional regulator/antitoxin component of YhaV-PrlF toxin-antitoxin module